ncbi:MFS transporter permease [Brevundimonas sp.]|uniref:MFS transporter permease n=1 Tax=Brevundimonas sp. TaxID=1871086 RepID=UPI0028AE6F7C|nr:MFS transporter permease [Brevundimonas sp.]
MADNQNPSSRLDVAVGATAAAGGLASMFAWAACCVLPLALSVAGVSAAGLAFANTAAFAEARQWLTLAAALIVIAGWFMHWRRQLMCRRGAACRRPAPLAFWLLFAATVMVGLSLIWQPYIDPWLLPWLASLR